MSVGRFVVFILSIILLIFFLHATAKMTKEIEIASFTTSIEGRTDAQIDNLKLAAAKIDGLIIRPGEKFSFNDIVGPRLTKFGYKGAPTIYQGKIMDTPGGGLCQLSSTIYNVALLAGLNVIDRTPHLWKIESVGPGRDAAILYNGSEEIDLKFINNYDFAVRLVVDINERRITARILGTKKPDYDISVNVETVDILAASNLKNNSPNSGKEGCKVKVFRLKHKDGGLIKRELISVDRYVPVPAKKEP